LFAYCAKEWLKRAPCDGSASKIATKEFMIDNPIKKSPKIGETRFWEMKKYLLKII
jgi:hypothetical protein